MLNSAGGGAALSARSLMEAMRSRGVEACAVCHEGGSAAEREALAEATGGAVCFTTLAWRNKKVRAALWKRPLLEARQMLRTGCGISSAAVVRRFAERHRVDLIHTNTILTAEGGRAARALGLGHVWHLRELLGPGQPFRLRREGAAFGRDVARWSSVLVANSHAAAERVRSWVGPGMLEVVPNGIDLAPFRGIEPRAEPGRPVVVGMVANLTSRVKKHGLLLDAFARIDRSTPVELRIYGHDPTRASGSRSDPYALDLHRRAGQEDLAGRVSFPGFLEPEAIMAEIDLLVHPADQESFGRVAVEAMAAGRPVVGARGGGIAEIVEDGATGLLAEADDAASFARSIERLALSPEMRRRFGTAGRKRAEALYSLEACAEGILRVYARALARPLGRRPAPGEPPP